MCLQLMCHICGEDLEDDKSLVPCFESILSPPLKPGDHTDCPDYVRKEAGAPSWCNCCSEVGPSVAGFFLSRPNPAFDYIE